MRMSPTVFGWVLERDGHRCASCGTGGNTLVPNHRLNRGMGGSKARETPTNVVTMCYECNGIIESDATSRAIAVAYGWKLLTGDDPDTMPWYDKTLDTWFQPDDDYGRNIVHLTDLPERYRT